MAMTGKLKCYDDKLSIVLFVQLAMFLDKRKGPHPAHLQKATLSYVGAYLEIDR